MSKPKTWDVMTPEQQEAWREKDRERNRKWREANPEKVRERKRKYHEANLEKVRERKRKYREKNRNQAAADQFFIMAGAAEQISKIFSARK